MFFVLFAYIYAYLCANHIPRRVPLEEQDPNHMKWQQSHDVCH